jgi:4-hydroxymandelate oxidase
MTELPQTIRDYEARAAEVMDAGPHGYYAGGAGEEVTLRDNEAAWQRMALRPRYMVDVSALDRRTTLLGVERPHPLIVAPTAFHALACEPAEKATALAAGSTDTIYTLSTLASTSAEDIAVAAPDTKRWFQLYVFKDRGVTRDMVERVTELGYEALVVTIDLPALGLRERDVRNGFIVAATNSIPSARLAGERGPIGILEAAALIDPSLTWPDVEELAEWSGLPVIVKGVMVPEDARRAVEHGAAGVVVSNHGGRQLDTVLSGADALGPVVDEVGDELDVIVDGGVRRGTDVVKALALGARAVMVGRPVLWGLAVGGEEGARHVLQMLLAQFDNALALSGAPVASELDRTFVQPGPWA